MLNGIVVNGVMGNCAMVNGVLLNGVMVDGVDINVVMVNGVMLNGVVVSGKVVNGVIVNGVMVNGVNDYGVNGNDEFFITEYYSALPETRHLMPYHKSNAVQGRQFGSAFANKFIIIILMVCTIHFCKGPLSVLHVYQLDNTVFRQMIESCPINDVVRISTFSYYFIIQLSGKVRSLLGQEKTTIIVLLVQELLTFPPFLIT